MAVALGGCVLPRGVQGAAGAAASPVFDATFDTPSDFFDRFDVGFSGFVPGQNGASSRITTFHGDHNMACDAPTTSRDVTLSGTAEKFDYSQVFWWCAPKGPPSGHVMTAVDTTGYNIAWFSPKQMFTDVSQVCWDINETLMSRRKWTQVVFVSAADAGRYPSGSLSDIGSIARGSGGFDLGFTNPDFQDENGTGFHPSSSTAGFRNLDGSANWFQGTSWVEQFVGPVAPDREQTTDKAARFKHCLTNGPGNTVILTKATPTTGTVVRILAGHIPPGPVRVVFQDDEYDGMKDDRYDANVLTWHWDNIHVEAGAAAAVAAPPTKELAAPVTSGSNDVALAAPAAAPAAESGDPTTSDAAVANMLGFGLTVAGLATVVVLWDRSRGSSPSSGDSSSEA